MAGLRTHADRAQCCGWEHVLRRPAKKQAIRCTADNAQNSSVNAHDLSVEQQQHTRILVHNPPRLEEHFVVFASMYDIVWPWPTPQSTAHTVDLYWWSFKCQMICSRWSADTMSSTSFVADFATPCIIRPLDWQILQADNLPAQPNTVCGHTVLRHKRRPNLP